MTARGYRHDIDGLRALAVISVLIFHAFPGALQGGFVGVDIFFVISGYLISSIIFERVEEGRFSFIWFYARRARRIFPALGAVLAATMIAGWFLLTPAEIVSLGTHALASALFVENLLLWSEAGYFDAASHLKPLLHIWSLGIEEQFYLAFPITAWAIFRWRVPLIPALVVLFLLSLAASIITTERSETMAFYFPHTRMWELLAGSLLAALTLPRLPALSFVGLAAIIVSLAAFGAHTTFPSGWAAIPVAGAVLVIAGGPDSPVNRMLLANPVVAYVGRISYPLYLWHWPLLSFLFIMEGEDISAEAKWGALLLAFALAAITYHAMERPLRLGRALYRPALASTAALLVIVALGGVWQQSDGFPGRFPEIAAQAAPLTDWPHEYQPPCVHRYGFDTYCRQTVPDAEPQVLVLGDSHANTAYFGFAELAERAGLPTLNIGEGGCLMAFDTATFLPNEPDPCKEDINAMLQWAVNAESIDTIILAQRWAYYRSGTGVLPADYYEGRKIVWEKAPTLGQAETFDRTITETLTRLVESGKHIIVVYDWPELGFDPRECLDIRPFRLWEQADEPECGLPSSRVEQRQRGYRQTFAELEQHFGGAVEFVDPLPLFCGPDLCAAMEGDEFLYRDDDHLTKRGSRRIAPLLMQALSGTPWMKD